MAHGTTSPEQELHPSVQTMRVGTRRLLAEDAEAGDAWLADCSARPDLVRTAWDAKALAEFPTGLHWRVAETPLLSSMEAIGWIGGERLGPVLADVYRGTMWWLLPPDLSDELDGTRQLTVRPPGWILKCPPVLHSVAGRWWIERPDGSGLLTDPAVLAAAFGPGGAPLPTEASR